MHVPMFISQMPVQISHAFHSVAVRGTKAKKCAVNILKSRRDDLAQSDFWKHSCKPFYERHFEPLKKGDYIFLGAMTCVAALVVFVSVKIFTVAAFPLALGCATLIFLLSCIRLRDKSRRHFNDIAINYVGEIRQIADQITPQNQKFGDISAKRALMSKPTFDHLDKELKQLDEEIRTFKSAVLASPYEDKKKMVKTHLTLLQNIVQGHAQDLSLLQALEQEVDKAGQPNQDFEALEKQKQKLHDLQTVLARDHIVDLQKQVNSLVKALQGPSLADSKKSILNYIEGLQNRLPAL